jgi:hypothetical protein
MYAYRYVDSADRKPAPARFRQLDKMIRTLFDTTKDKTRHPEELIKAGTVYMWDPRFPLQMYMNMQFKKDSTVKPLRKWASMGPMYADYGNWLIRTYPWAFAEYYLWPNAIKYYTPPVEFLETYNMGNDSVAQIAKTWFHYKDSKVKSLFKDFKVSTLDFYPILIGALNVVFLVSFLFFQLLKGHQNTIPPGILWLAAGLWLVNFCFSVFASPIALRFQVFPVLIYLSVALLLIEQICKVAFSKPTPTA